MKLQKHLLVVNRQELRLIKRGEEIKVIFGGALTVMFPNAELGEASAVFHLGFGWLKLVAVSKGAFSSKFPEMFQLLVDMFCERRIAILDAHCSRGGKEATVQNLRLGSRCNARRIPPGCFIQDTQGR
jgi:hypothetical protein